MGGPPRGETTTPPPRSDRVGTNSEAPREFGTNIRLLPTNGLTADAWPEQECLVTVRVGIAKVGQKPATLGDQGQ